MLPSTVNKYENKRKDREQQKKNKLVFSLICFKRENVKLICFVYAFASRKKKKEQKKTEFEILASNLLIRYLFEPKKKNTSMKRSISSIQFAFFSLVGV